MEAVIAERVHWSHQNRHDTVAKHTASFLSPAKSRQKKLAKDAQKDSTC